MCIRTVPFGYAVEKGKKVIVADEAAVIIEVYEHYCSGETFKQIADSLTARGVKYLKNDSQWNKNNVARLIDDSRYLGNEEYPQIVPAELYERVRTCREGTDTRWFADLNSPPLNSELLSKLSMQRDSSRRQAGSTTEKPPISYSTYSMLLKLNYIRLI